MPANPDIIWQENREKTSAYWKQPEEMAFRRAKVKELYEHYRRNFKKYGIGIETGSITGLFNILYNKKGPFWACDFRRVLSHDPKEPQYYLGTIYLQDDLIDHIKENFEAARAKSMEWDEV